MRRAFQANDRAIVSRFEFGYSDAQEARFAKGDFDAEETGVSDEIIEVETLDAIRVSPEVTRAFEAGVDGLEVLAVGARHDGDGEMFPGWWSD